MHPIYRLYPGPDLCLGCWGVKKCILPQPEVQGNVKTHVLLFCDQPEQHHVCLVPGSKGGKEQLLAVCADLNCIGDY